MAYMEFQESVWNGYKWLDFIFEEHEAILVVPDVPTKDKRWLFKTEYFGAFPNFEIEMLGRGYYLAHVQSIELTGADAMEKAARLMSDLRGNIPENIGGAKVTVVRDYRSSIAKDVENGIETKINLPASNVLEFILGKCGSVIARPSGTEPKVKFYYTAVANDKISAKTLLNAMIHQMSK